METAPTGYTDNPFLLRSPLTITLATYILMSRRSVALSRLCTVSLFPDTPMPATERTRGMGLALVPVEGKPATYKRVGHVQELRYQLFMALPREAFTLV